MLSKLFVRNVPVVGTTAGFVKTAYYCTKCATVGGAVGTAVKGVFLNCTPPVIAYPALCAALGATTVVAVCTGNPLVASAAIQCAEACVEEIFK